MILVAVDGQSLYGKKSGLGVYTTALVSAMRETLPNDIQLTILPDSKSSFSGGLNTPTRLKWEIAEFPKCVKNGNYDIAHIPAFSMGWPRAKTVLTVHDLIGMAFPNQKGLASKFYWGQWLPWAAKRADHIIADSKHTQSDLMKFLNIPEKKITQIYPSGHEAYAGNPESGLLEPLKLRLNIKPDYFLCVGTLEPRKNLKRVIEAHRIICERYGKPNVSLVLVGGQDFARGQFYKNLFGESGDLHSNVIFSGYLKNEELHALYSGAQALIFPSLYEGFGLPLLEAMAAGCPVISSKMSSLPEVGGKAVFYVDPLSTESIVLAMETLLTNSGRRAELILEGKKQITFFSWKDTALKTFEVYRKIANKC